MDTFWVRDEHHAGPLPPLQWGIWVEPMSAGFRRSMADWGIPVRGFTSTLIDGWVYGSFGLLDDEAEVARRVERRLALPADAEERRAQRWLTDVLPAWRARRRSAVDGLDRLADADLGDQVQSVVSSMVELIEARFADIAISAPYARWVLLTEARMGWDRARAVAELGLVSTSPWLDLDPADPAAFLDEHGDLSLGDDVLAPTVRERFDGRLAEGRAAAGADGAAPTALDAELEAARAAGLTAQRWREATADELTHWLGVLRRVGLEAGRRLSARGLLPDAEAALFLEWDELAQALRGVGDDPGPLTQMRRTAHAESAATPPAPFVGPPPSGPPPLPEVPPRVAEAMRCIAWTGQHLSAPPGPPAADETTVRGVAASPGRVTGRVRVVHDTDQLWEVEPGDVIVCLATNPSWEPVLAIAGALVCDTGGFVSHAALVARELGIPAVVGTKLATVVLQDGASVTVDGDAGTLERDPAG